MFESGDRVKVTTSKFEGMRLAPQRGDVLYVKEPYLNMAGETLAGAVKESTHGYYFREGEIEIVKPFSVGDKVRLVNDMRSHGIDIGSIGIVSEDDEYTSSYETLVNFPADNGNEQWYYVREDEIELVAEEQTFGEVIEIVLNRFRRAADAVGVNDKNDLATALRGIVPAILLQPNSEQILRELAGN